MAKTTVNNIRLGAFVLGGLFFLILLLYMIGKNENMFGAKFVLRARFGNVQGLLPGNNVRYSGIEAGTVKEVRIINDTTIEVVLLIQTTLKNYIRKNALVSIGTDGLMGNKLVNITAAGAPAAGVEDGDLLESRKPLDTDEMLRVLNATNRDIAVIAGNLKSTVQRVNNSAALWKLLDDAALPANLRASLLHTRSAAEGVDDMVADLQWMVQQVRGGKGSLGTVLTDTSLAHNLNDAIGKIQAVGLHADSLSRQISSLVAAIHQDVEHGEGPAHALLKDKELVDQLSRSLQNIEKGTAAFNENMEAMKNSFLLRGYYKKLERQKSSKQAQPAAVDTNHKLSSAN